MKHFLIITTCIHNKYGIKNSTERTNLYKHCITNVLSLLSKKIIPIIVENSGVTESFLDDFGIDVVYTQNNAFDFPRPTYKAKNELLDIEAVIKKYDIKDDDVIIKLTGRYEVLDDTFFEHILRTSSTYDAWVKFYNVARQQYMKYDCVLGLYAIQCKHLKKFDYAYKQSPEVEFANFVRQFCNVEEIECLGLKCCFADNGKYLTV